MNVEYVWNLQGQETHVVKIFTILSVLENGQVIVIRLPVHRVEPSLYIEIDYSQAHNKT